MAIFIFDFDSTLVSLESLDETLAFALKNNGKKARILKQIGDITQQGMNGEKSLRESLQERTQLAQITTQHIAAAAELMRHNTSKDAQKTVRKLQEQGHRVCIMSGGFREVILPAANDLGIVNEDIFANTFIMKGDEVVAIDQNNPLSDNGGKPAVLSQLRSRDLSCESSKIIMIGDGISDAETKVAGAADHFWAYTEHARRESVVAQADIECKDMSEVIEAIIKLSP